MAELEVTLTRADANHDAMTDTHSHAHPAFGSQGDDTTHEHEHSHDNDNDHDHKHAQDRVASSNAAISMYAPITRIDPKEWLIEGQATDDNIDSYGTIFDYESSKKAFEKWRGNVREMHKNEAVGRAVEWYPDDDNRAIILRARISKGAPNTWEKICDGTLNGFSISIPEGHYKTRSIERNGKKIPVYYDHDLAEVSVVDAPGNFKSNFALVRADGLTTELLDTTEEETPNTPSSLASSSSLDRVGARVGSGTRSAMHDSIGHTLRAAVSQMQNCGCDCCGAAQKMIDPDGDGDIDMGGYDDPDSDWQSLYNQSSTDSDMERKITGMVERALSPVYARLQGIAGTLARSNVSTNNINIESIVSGAITRAVEANEASLSVVRADLSAVKETVDRIDNTPVPGAPIMNASATRPPAIDKQLPTDPIIARSTNGGAIYDAMVQQFGQMSQNNMFRTTDEQLAAAAKVLATQPAIGRR